MKVDLFSISLQTKFLEKMFLEYFSTKHMNFVYAAELDCLP